MTHQHIDLDLKSDTEDDDGWRCGNPYCDVDPSCCPPLRGVGNNYLKDILPDVLPDAGVIRARL